MNLEEALQALADEKAKSADISRNFKSYRELHEEREGELQKQVETLSKEKETAVEDLKKEYDTFKSTVEETEKTRKSSYMEKKIEEMTKGDKKLQEKLKAEYAMLNMPEDNEDNISAKLEKARTIISVQAPVGAAEAAGAGGAVGGDGGSSNEQVSPAVASLLSYAGVPTT